jgi:hypothetical protein
MLSKQIKAILARFRFAWFSETCDRKVHWIFGHINGIRRGFPFRTREQMNKQTELRDIRAMLDLIDQQAPEMGKAYGETFRFLLYRDMYARLELYIRHVQRHIPHESRIKEYAK